MERVREITQNLEHNAYGHHQSAHHIVTTACVAYLLQDVRNPPPSVLLNRGLDAYLAHVNKAGAIVMLEYLRGAGFPTLQWQRAARRGRGDVLRKLFAYSFHVYRGPYHKPVAVQIALIALLGFYCVLPSLQAVLVATCSISLLGRADANMYFDRLLETINNLQQGSKRSASGSSFGRAMDMTTLLRPMMHVRHAFRAHECGATESDDPVTDSMLVMVRMLQDEFRRLLGTVLTALDPLNCFWHTGTPVDLASGDYRTYRPWEWVWRTASGVSLGKGRSRFERWELYVRRFVFHHFFPF